MAVSLPSPGVRVTQVFRSVSPTIITPTLPACVVGVAKQIVEVVKTSSGSSALNTEALITLPGFFIAPAAPGSPPAYTGLDGLKLVLSINNGPNVTILFSGTSLTPTAVVSQITEAFLDAGVTEALAETVGTDSFRIRSVGVGDFQTLRVVGGVGGTDAAVAAAFGLVLEYSYPGRGAYDQYNFVIPPSNLPDPRHNLNELAIEWDTVRVFLALGNGADFFEVKRTQSFLRNGGTASAAVMTGSVDLSTLTYSTAAVHTGSADVTAGGLYGPGGTLHGLTLVMNVNGGGLQTLTFNGATNTANQGALLTAIGTLWSAITATVGGPGGNKLVLTDELFGTPSTFIIDASSTALVALGLTADTYTGTNGDVTNQTLVLSVSGGANQTVTFAYPNNQGAILTQINAIVNPALAATAPSNDLVLTTLATSYAASIKVVSGAAAALLGLTVGAIAHGINGVAAIDDGNGDALTPLIQMNAADFTAAATVATMQGNVDVTALSYPGALSGKTLTLSDGDVAQTLTFGTIANATALAAAIQAFWPNFTVDINATNLRIRTTAVGAEAVIKAVGGNALTVLGLTVGAVAHGAPFAPLSGDELWVDGTLLGRITQVAPGGAVSVLKIDKQVPINPSLGASFYIVAKNLTGAATATRPSSDLILDLHNNVHIKHEILRDTTGTALATGRAQVYVAYHAVRKDVTSSAKDPGLLTFESTTDLEAQLAPISADNPLALGMYFALLNAPGNQIMGLGVDEVSASEPYGTVESFTRAAEYLEAFEVYGISPLTHNPTVGQVFMAHVDAMSQEDMKGARICVFNSAQPSSKIDKLVASGLNGNSASALTFDTGVQNLAQLLLGEGVNPVGTIPVSEGVFLDIAQNDLHYSITSVAGSVVTIKVAGFAAGENDDGFYATTNLAAPPLPSVLIDEAFAIRIRGAALVLPDGVTPDRAGIAETYQQLGQSYNDRRFWNVVPDKCAATINGFEQTLEGFYMCAAIVGAIGKQKPEQSFTNFPIVGFTRVIGTTDFFTQKQLGIIMAGGNWVMIQPTKGGPLLSKYALTTNMTSVETKTDSITKIVDFVDKFVRNGLRNFIGRFNINQGFLDTLGHVLQGLLAFLQDQGTLNGFTVKRIVQDENNPDTVLIDIQLDVPFPCNFIDVTLVI